MPNENDKTPQQEDLTKDMQFPGDEYVNMEGESRSTATEGALISPEKDPANTSKIDEEAKDEAPTPKEDGDDSLEKVGTENDKTSG